MLKLLELPVEGNRYEMLQRFQDYQDERRSKVRRVAAAEAVVDGEEAGSFVCHLLHPFGRTAPCMRLLTAQRHARPGYRLHAPGSSDPPLPPPGHGLWRDLDGGPQASGARHAS